jgi:hypothetical protein
MGYWSSESNSWVHHVHKPECFTQALSQLVCIIQRYMTFVDKNENLQLFS